MLVDNVGFLLFIRYRFLVSVLVLLGTLMVSMFVVYMNVGFSTLSVIVAVISFLFDVGIIGRLVWLVYMGDLFMVIVR